MFVLRYIVNDSIIEKRAPTCNKKLQSIASIFICTKFLAEHQKKSTNDQEKSIFEKTFWASIPKLSQMIAMCIALIEIIPFVSLLKFNSSQMLTFIF